MNEDVKAEKKRDLRICVISFPMPSALVVNVFLYSLVEILEPICKMVYVVTSKLPKDRTFNKKIRIQDVKTAMHSRDIIRPMWWSTVLQFFIIILIQLKMCWTLTKISKEIDIVIFYIGGANFFPPVLMAKALRKKVIVLAPGRGSLSYRKPRNERLLSIGSAFAAIISILERANFYLADQVAVESESSIGFLGLNKYRKKISIMSEPHINFDLFNVRKDFNNRRNFIGYIGRLSQGKGVMNFTKAIPLILKERNDLEFLIGGNGPLFDEIKHELKTNGSYDKVEFTGWISHDELPDYLNELKLIVLPTYSEGGIPAIIQEAMACGTIILVTPVAGVIEKIKDGENGFILMDNSPEGIAKKVIQILDHPELNKVMNNARNLVENEYSYESTVKRYRSMLYRVLR
ncbi:MAG TPA: glycosyltransferase family 4 protein [Candidatus Methanofastidiosum sp.]|nr:glycosyltransferase family 4 protein [Methanofastidiosum sp.]